MTAHSLARSALLAVILCFVSGFAPLGAISKTRGQGRELSHTRQLSPPPRSKLGKVERLYRQRNWQEVVRLTAPQPGDPPDIDYYRGMALAKLQRLPEAKQAFERGREKALADKRFPIELGGIEFLTKHYSAARNDLRQALRLDPHDTYAENFLATIYELEGNLEAALKYWNRIGKPVVHSVEFSSPPQLDPVLLNRAFTFAPGETLQLSELLTTQAGLDSMGIFYNPQIRLQPLPNGQWDAVLSTETRGGWGQSTRSGFLSLLRGLPYETVYPEFFNLRGSATNLQSLLRWDPQKERVFASLSGPLGENPNWRYQLYVDGRRENWNIAHTFFATNLPVNNMHMETIVGGADVQAIVNGRLSWSDGLELSGSTFRNVHWNQSSATPFFRNGFSLEDRSSLHVLLATFPEERFTLAADLSAQLGKVLSRPANIFLQTEGGLLSHWYPKATGDDLEMTTQLRAGRTWGAIPFDQLFILGLERDNDLWLRADIATADGKKGSAPLGRNYGLFNWDDYKNIYRNGFLTVRLGPFFDSGKISDPTGDFGSQRWLFDTGLELKIGVLGQATVELFFGKDLRTGATTFYGTTESGQRPVGSHP